MQQRKNASGEKELKIQIASDLHLDLLHHRFPEFLAVRPADADVLVIAGDIHLHDKAVAAFRDWPVPVVYVHGNHELYGGSRASIVARLRESAAGTRVHFLEQGEYVLNGVRFLGCCLWTDYVLFEGMRDQAMEESDRYLMDSKRIVNDDGTPFSAANSTIEHAQALAWLTRKLAQPFEGKTVVVTHHAPHPDSIHARFAGNILNAGFITDLTRLIMQYSPELWIHGHVHDSFDYRIGATRIVANPRGYARNRNTAATLAELAWENPAFDAGFVAEI
jgi:Icc-related predicted phosphoesterase